METMNDKSAAISDAKLIMQFIYGGNAIFTLVSSETAIRYTYRVNEKVNSDKSVVHFVSLLNGPDNKNDYTYLGWIRNNQFGLTNKSFATGLTEHTPSVRAFKWAFSNFASGVVPEKLEFWHEGRCARCSRPLTVPESLANGFGPECITKVGAMAAGQAPVVGSQRPPSDAEVTRMVNALRNFAPENFMMDGEMATVRQATNFWFKRYKKQPLSAAELVEMENSNA